MNRTFWSQTIGVIGIAILTIQGIHAQLDLDQIQTQLPDQIAKTNISLNDAKELFRNKCIEVAGETAGGQAYGEIESGFVVLTECLNGIVNYTAMQEEIQEASPKGELDVVFNKYCSRRSNAVQCVDTFTAQLVPCLSTEEREGQDVIKQIIQSLLNFVCHKDGDQIALFIAEKGPECIESQKENIQQCVNNTFAEYLNLQDPQDNRIKTIPKLTVGEKQCDEMLNLQACVVSKLETCSDITPANLVESMFNFIRNQTLCRDHQRSPQVAAAAAAAASRAFPQMTHNVLPHLAFYLLILRFCFRKSP
ncbi:27 kDa hemolymph protein [Drosophila subpulchrella]|uniref:27 kDa hemolymph protein n=1 Tax=Drosophila subpulchrella TaxID=1486046 RepID=UPI0018A186B4|nr:27 kDa hemolymph protein [Drosophila subpulchrella]